MMKYALNLVILENRMATSIDCQELQVDNDHHHHRERENKPIFQREEIESLETIFGSAWSKYVEDSETYRLALERNVQQRVELQVIYSKKKKNIHSV